MRSASTLALVLTLIGAVTLLTPLTERKGALELPHGDHASVVFGVS